MILWGKISDFSVFMVLQLLASYGKSGILELKDDEERAVIYLHEGFVEAVSVPRSDHLLGARLVRKGLVTENQLRRIMLSANFEGEEHRFLGLVLMKSGLVDEQAIAETIREQTYDNTLELSNWVKGTFRFIVPRKQVLFPVSPRINVQHLLLETSRRLDEGHRPSKAKLPLPGKELCKACTINCTAAEKEKYLKDGICLWRNMPTVVRESIYTPKAYSEFEEEEEERIRDLPFL